MKITKILIGLVLLGSQTVQAKMTCEVEVLSSACGSGVVRLEIDRGQFNLLNGDVLCWGSDIIHKGEFQPFGSGHSGFTESYRFKLFGHHSYAFNDKVFEPSKAYDVGLVTIEPKRKVAKLIYTEKALGIHKKLNTYFLKCKGEL